MTAYDSHMEKGWGNLMKRKLVSLILTAMAVTFMAGCSKISEPWDTRDHFKQERSRSMDQQEGLRHRLLASQVER